MVRSVDNYGASSVEYTICWAIPYNMHTPPTEDMVCLSQGVIQTSTVLGGTESYFVVSRGVNSTVLGGKLLC